VESRDQGLTGSAVLDAAWKDWGKSQKKVSNVS